MSSPAPRLARTLQVTARESPRFAARDLLVHTLPTPRPAQ